MLSYSQLRGASVAPEKATSSTLRVTASQKRTGFSLHHTQRSSVRLVLVCTLNGPDPSGVPPLQLLFRRAELDNLSSVVAPAILAVYSLNLQQITYMDAAIAMFGCAPS